MLRSILLVSSLLLVTAAQGGAAQDDDAEWATAPLFDCAVESTGDGSFDETCAVESADARLAGTWSFSYDIETLEGEGVISVDAGNGAVSYKYNPEDVELHFGEVTIVTADGRWKGGARRMHPARMVAQPIRPDRRVEGDSGYSTAANIARVLFPLIVFALVVAGAGISLLKGHWWMGLLGALGFGVYALWSTQVSLDIDLLGRFEENVENNIGLAIFIASSAGALLLLLGAVLPARSGSWWDRNRTTQPVSD